MRRGLLSGLLHRSIVGIDTGSSSVKVVKLSANSEQRDFHLEKYVSELTERSAVADGNLMDIDAAGNTPKRTVAKADIRGRRAVLAIPASLTESQTVSLPDNLTEDELFVQVESGANRLFPPSQNVNFDYVVISSSETEGGVGMRVTTTVSERVIEHVAAAEMTDLKAIVMDVGENAIQHAITHTLTVEPDTSEIETRDMPVMVMFHLGDARSCALFYQGWKELYEQPTSGSDNQLTQSVSRLLSLDLLKVEMKKRKNTLPDKYRSQLLKPSLETLAIEVNQAIQNFLSTSSTGRVNEIMPSGGHASLLGVQTAIQQQTRINATLANPFVNMGAAKNVNARYLQRDLPAYIVSTGPALHGLRQGADDGQ